MESADLKRIVEALLFAADRPLSVNELLAVFDEHERPGRDELVGVLRELAETIEGRGVELSQSASGYRFRVPAEFSPWVSRLWAEKSPRYSRAMLETLAVIAYRQPVTRGDIEEVRGVAVGSNIIRALQEREWIRVVGHRDVPGRPELLATTRHFLDYFGLKGLEQLPSLAEIKDFEQIDPVLDLPIENEQQESSTEARADGGPLTDAVSDEVPGDEEAAEGAGVAQTSPS